MEAHTFQRLGAYFADVIILSIIVMILTLWIPTSEKYNEAVKRSDELIGKIASNDVSLNEVSDEYVELRYTIDKESMLTTMVTIVVYLAYFATYAYNNNGQTIGKKLFKIRIVPTDDNELSHINFVGRALLINGIVFSCINCIFLLFISSKQYLYTVGLVNIIESIIIITSFLMVIIRSDKRGIHDLLFKTKVISEK